MQLSFKDATIDSHDYVHRGKIEYRWFVRAIRVRDNELITVTSFCSGVEADHPTNKILAQAVADRINQKTAEHHQPTNVEDAAAGNLNAIRHLAYAEGYADGKAFVVSHRDESK